MLDIQWPMLNSLSSDAFVALAVAQREHCLRYKNQSLQELVKEGRFSFNVSFSYFCAILNKIGRCQT